MIDLWSYTPYYDRYLCESLAKEGIGISLAAVSPCHDPQYFARYGFLNDPGLLDLVSKLPISNATVRRTMMLLECCINMTAFAARFAVSKPDIVHVQWMPMVRKLPFEIWFVKLLKRMGIRLVYTVHNLLPHDSRTSYASIFRSVYTWMDGLICHDEETKSRLCRHFGVQPECICIIPHGPLLHDSKRLSSTTSKSLLSLPEDEIVVLFQGFIRPYKGLDFLLESWRLIHKQGLGARLVIAGTGEREDLQAIRRRVATLNLNSTLRLDLQYIPDEHLSAYYQAADVIVFPYREVTTSGALMAALSHDKAIVATNLPAFQQILGNGDRALFVEYGDVGALAESLSMLIKDPAARARLASSAVGFGGVHPWSYVAQQTRKCYESILHQRRTTNTSIAASSLLSHSKTLL